MSMLTFAEIVGQKSGPVKGSITQKGRENSIGVIAASHSIVIPRDLQTGLPSGRRMHKPFVFTKELDRATPVLYNMLCTNENIPTATFRFWAPKLKSSSGVGAEIQNYTVKLTNAKIASYDFRKTNIHLAELGSFAEYEEIVLTYQKIEWTWNDGKISAGDDWDARV